MVAISAKDAARWRILMVIGDSPGDITAAVADGDSYFSYISEVFARFKKGANADVRKRLVLAIRESHAEWYRKIGLDLIASMGDETLVNIRIAGQLQLSNARQSVIHSLNGKADARLFTGIWKEVESEIASDPELPFAAAISDNDP